ncbi:MAG: putative Zn finger protein, partial [Saprospiraceae bacterium]
MRKSYGTTYWGKQFLNALNEIDYSNRLPRGKTYANKGTVSDINIVNNHISADVQGSRYKPYKVKFNFPTFSAKQKAQILELVTDNPAYLSKLLNRELPSALDKACSRLGIDIFPSTWRDVHGNCSCPDSAVPCKHMAATLYIIANEIDKNPFAVFGLHDFDLFKGLEGIGYTAMGERDIYIPSLSDITENFSFEIQDFEWEEAIFDKLDFSPLSDCREQLMTLLSDHTVFFPEGDFKKILESAYKSLNKTFLKKKKADAPDDTDALAENAEEIEIILDKELDFLNCNLRDGRGKSVAEYTNLNKLIDWLETIPLSRFDRISVDLRGLVLINALAQKLAIKSALIPQLLRVGTKRYKVRWMPALMNETVQNVTRNVSQLTPPDLLFFKLNKDIKQSNSEEQFTSLLSLFLTHYMNESFNMNAKINQTEVGRMFFNGGLENFGSFDNREHPKAIQLWLNKFYISERDYVPVIHVEDSEEIFEVSIAVNDKTKPLETPIPLPDIFEKKKYNHMRLEILRSLSMLSDYFPGINDILASKGTLKLEFDSEEFTAILFKILPVIQLFGIQVLLPKALRKLMRPKVSLSMDVSESGAVGGNSIINLEEMLRFQWKIAIGNNQVSFGDFLKMVKKYKGIVKINDAYVYFDKDEIHKLLTQLENPPELSNNDLLQVALTEDYDGARVELSKQLKALMNNLLSGDPVAQPDGLKATLRPYQQRGFEWLYKNTRLGFGSIIADDMGLGKTLQVITT